MLVIAKYIGHVSHAGYSRGTEHLDDLKKKPVSCRAYQHAIDKHDGNIPVFQMKVTGIYRDDTMHRKISEAVGIRNANPKNLLNNKLVEYPEYSSSDYNQDLKYWITAVTTSHN